MDKLKLFSELSRLFKLTKENNKFISSDAASPFLYDFLRKKNDQNMSEFSDLVKFSLYRMEQFRKFRKQMHSRKLFKLGQQ